MSACQNAAAPVSATEFAQALARLDAPDSIAVAFSGGPDSLALLCLAARWAKSDPQRKLVALTVDHGLRVESADEALLCARMAKALGVAHRILVWVGSKPGAGIQAAAREARYQLLADACLREGVGALLVAHHLEDQAETFLLRLARGSGVDGLAGMATSRPLRGDVCLLRPLLDMPRARLAAVLHREKRSAIQDPSNDNPRFDRVKARRLMAELSGLGLDAQRLADTAAHMARARAALDMETRALLSAHALLAATGHIEVDAEALVCAPEEIGLRALGEILKCVGGTAYRPRFDALKGLYRALETGVLGRGRTLNGCKLVAKGKNIIAVRERRAALDAAPLTLKPGERGVWDGRFAVLLVSAPKQAKPLEVRALGPEGVAVLMAARQALPDAPKAALPALPGLWAGGKLLAAPHFGWLTQGYAFEAVALRQGFFGPA